MISSVKHVRYLAGWCTSELKWRQTNQTKNSETFATRLQGKYLGKPQKHLLKQNQMALMHYNIREANFSIKPCSKNANCIFYCGQNPQSNKDEKDNGPQENNMKVQAAWENFSETRLGNELWAWEIIMQMYIVLRGTSIITCIPLLVLLIGIQYWNSGGKMSLA